MTFDSSTSPTFSDLDIEPHSPPDTLSYFHIQNRRYLGNKHRLSSFIEDVVGAKCEGVRSFCDIFAGTGVVGNNFNKAKTKIIANDILHSNYVCLASFLATRNAMLDIEEKIQYLNSLPTEAENYFSEHFGGTYFSHRNARKIGKIREAIEEIAANSAEKNILVCSLIYATDKVANTVGHYDAFRKNMDMLQPIRLRVPLIDYVANEWNEVYSENANELIKRIECDVLYLDPPYNSRQYSDGYHVLENLSEWKKPPVAGYARKMNRTHIKSNYCLKNAPASLRDLVARADCRHILLSYNNTKTSKDGRSNARISDEEIMDILNSKGDVEIFEVGYKSYTTGRSRDSGNIERIFYCEVRK